jgi:hypothetical protein
MRTFYWECPRCGDRGSMEALSPPTGGKCGRCKIPVKLWEVDPVSFARFREWQETPLKAVPLAAVGGKMFKWGCGECGRSGESPTRISRCIYCGSERIYFYGSEQEPGADVAKNGSRAREANWKGRGTPEPQRKRWACSCGARMRYVGPDPVNCPECERKLPFYAFSDGDRGREFYCVKCSYINVKGKGEVVDSVTCPNCFIPCLDEYAYPSFRPKQREEYLKVVEGLVRDQSRNQREFDRRMESIRADQEERAKGESIQALLEADRALTKYEEKIRITDILRLFPGDDTSNDIKFLYLRTLLRHWLNTFRDWWPTGLPLVGLAGQLDQIEPGIAKRLGEAVRFMLNERLVADPGADPKEEEEEKAEVPRRKIELEEG